jgi:hypothetical protein
MNELASLREAWPATHRRGAAVLRAEAASSIISEPALS